jgi:hypothetical protein
VERGFLTCSVSRYYSNTTLRNVGNYSPSALRHTPVDRLLLVNNFSETTFGFLLRKEGYEAPTDMDSLETNTYFKYLDQQVLGSTYIVIHADHIWKSSCCTIDGNTKFLCVGPFRYPINRNVTLITKGKPVPVWTMKTYRESIVTVLLCWTSAPGGKVHASTIFPMRKNPCTFWIGGWMDHGVGLGSLERRIFIFSARNRI